jgi:dihydroflavonol-4-reductase
MPKGEMVLVTGATGFIGSSLCRRLVEEGYRVRALHRPTSSLVALEGLAVERVVGDILDLASLRPAVEGAGWVFHTAAQSDYWKRPRGVVEAAVVGTANVVGAARETGARRLVLTSSIAAMGVPRRGQPLDESDRYSLRPKDFPYGYGKLQSEMAALREAGDRLEVVIVNPSVVLGPGDVHQISGSLVIEAARGRTVVWMEGGINIVHIADVVEGHLAAMRLGRSGERYVLGGENHTHREVFTLLAEIAGRRPPWLKIPHAALGPLATIVDALRLVFSLPLDGGQLRMSGHYLYCDTSKARRDLRLGAPRPFRQAAQETYDWYRAQGVI